MKSITSGEITIAEIIEQKNINWNQNTFLRIVITEYLKYSLFFTKKEADYVFEQISKEPDTIFDIYCNILEVNQTEESQKRFTEEQIPKLRLFRLGEKGFWYKDINKKCIGKVDSKYLKNQPEPAIDVWGYYLQEDGKWVCFITDSKKGIFDWIAVFDTETEVVNKLIKKSEEHYECGYDFLFEFDEDDYE